jgi:glyoxylase-like metal-dependent hydrolase (beta-lactamase superfamily II)/predicted SnoaL-like aldol condensation-catalyzing enzyme
MMRSEKNNEGSMETNKQVVLKVLKGAFIERDPTVVDRYFSPDYVQHNPVIPNGPRAIANLIPTLTTLSYEIGMVVAEGDLVMVHGRYVGWGPKPLVAVDIFKVNNGKVVEHWDVMQEEVPASATASGNPMFTPATIGSVPPVLSWEVFVTPGIPIRTADRPADITDTFFQAMASTLIYGEMDAVLVDTFMTAKQANDLADWVEAKGKNLTTIYITHGHGDHWFGAGTLLERFPKARLVATPNSVEVMKVNASPKVLDGAWKAGFPGQIPDNLVIADALNGNVIALEGKEMVVVELGHTDTDYTTCLHVPSIGLVVAGDAAYNDVHLYLAESNEQTRQEWIAALDKIEALKPRAVVASHKRPENEDDPKIIEETRKYIRDFDRLVKSTSTAQELYDKMLALYPNRVNPGWALWGSVRAFKS